MSNEEDCNCGTGRPHQRLPGLQEHYGSKVCRSQVTVLWHAAGWCREEEVQQTPSKMQISFDYDSQSLLCWYTCESSWEIPYYWSILSYFCLPQRMSHSIPKYVFCHTLLKIMVLHAAWFSACVYLSIFHFEIQTDFNANHLVESLKQTSNYSFLCLIFIPLVYFVKVERSITNNFCPSIFKVGCDAYLMCPASCCSNCFYFTMSHSGVLL